MASDLPEKFGQEKLALGGKGLKRKFESASSRTAVRGPTGEVHRGRTLHANVYQDIAEKAGKTFDEILDEVYDPVTIEPTGKYIEGSSRGQEGKFFNREQAAKMSRIEPMEEGFLTSEEIRDLEYRRAKESPGLGRRETRAGGSADPVDQARRRNRAKRTHGYLEKMKAEEKLLKGKRPNPRKSPESLRKLELDAKTAIPGSSRGFREAVRSRLNLIDRRKQVLKALGRKAGLLGLVASPYTTGEALVGLGSKDSNTRLRSVEILQGMPEFSTGRGMTTKEKQETPVWHDPSTGEWKI